MGVSADLPASRNGLPTLFFFNALSSPIAAIAITLDSITFGGGFGSDNFNATEAPAPGAMGLVPWVGAVLLGRRRR